MDAKQIKPAKRGQSDFFSWQLYRWVKANPQRLQVYASTWNRVSGLDPQHPVLMIGRMDEDFWFSGLELRGLCCHGASLQSWAYGQCHDTPNWTDCTEAFWSDYIKKGVCAIHGDYAHSWNIASEDERICDYCGQREVKHIEHVAKVVWRSAPTLINQPA